MTTTESTTTRELRKLSDKLDQYLTTKAPQLQSIPREFIKNSETIKTNQ